jgi:tetratricopeptide (TPR) repeat protein
VDDYYIVRTPVAKLGTKDLNTADLPIEEIRHMYLHYLLDSLPFKYSEMVDTKKALADYALGSPTLEQQYKSDFLLLTTECLIKAIESRLDRKPAAIDQAMREGFVMTPAFAERLVEYEKQEQSMRLFFRELVEGIDLGREEKRLDHIDFVSTNAARRSRTVTREVAQEPELTGAAKTLDDAEKAYASRDLANAKDIFLRCLRETDEKPLHAKAYYGLARIAVLEKDPQKADELFRVALEQGPDAETKSWSLLYLARLADAQVAGLVKLGRLADAQQFREEAVKNYEAALAVEGVPASVRAAAVKGLETAPGKKNN